MKNMEKKKYIAPECEVIEMETEPLLLSTSFEDSDFDEEEFGGGVNMGANRHRGEWGNLWGNKK